jgi:phosphate transport system substrate-binding protein
MKQFIKCVAIAMLGFGSSVAIAETRLSGAGATFPQPLYERWVGEYVKAHPDVRIEYGGGGSGAGIKGITEKTLDFAGSDAPMSKSELEKAGGEDNIIQVPSCAGGVVPAYNLSGVNNVYFTGEVLAEIYMGKITTWNDPKLVAINPGVNLPGIAITVAARADGSGTNFVWTNYLATQSEDFKTTIGVGKQVKWPVGQTGKGNPGVAAIIQQTPGAIGYVEENYATKNNLSFGAVQNKAGKFVKSSPETVSNAGSSAVNSMSGHVLAASLWNQGGDNSYPIATFTYLIVYKDLSNLKDKQQAQAMVDFINWAMHDGQKIAPELDYAPLSAAVQKKVDDALGTITYKGEAIKSAMSDAAK